MAKERRPKGVNPSISAVGADTALPDHREREAEHDREDRNRDQPACHDRSLWKMATGFTGDPEPPSTGIGANVIRNS
jgi:hypothetical protein